MLASCLAQRPSLGAMGRNCRNRRERVKAAKPPLRHRTSNTARRLPVLPCRAGRCYGAAGASVEFTARHPGFPLEQVPTRSRALPELSADRVFIHRQVRGVITSVPLVESPAVPRGPSIAWLGGAAVPELAWARQEAGRLAPIVDLSEPGAIPVAHDVDGTRPALVLLASDVPARWSLGDAVRVSRCWPLAPLVSVASSLAEGRRRSGPPLSGIEEVPWNDLPARLIGWLADLRHGRRGTLGLPATARREDRVLAATDRVGRGSTADGAAWTVSVAASRPADVEGAADLLVAAGHVLARSSSGRPPLDEPADVLVWDVDRCTDEHLAWLRMLAANRPRLVVVLVVSFPRLEVVQAALAAGAATVLGRPLTLESLAGALLARGA